MSRGMSLVERHTDATQKIILASAIELLEQSSVGELTVRATAKRAGISERTVFRYIASRNEFLDAVADEVTRTLQLPPIPLEIEALLTYPKDLYTCFEERADLAKAALHTEMFKRLREGPGVERWQAIQTLIDAHAPHRSDHDRKIAAANIRYYLAATTWHYYRFYFGFTLEDAIASAQLVIKQSIDGLTN